MGYVLVRYSDNYADEFDIEGLAVIETQDWVKYLENMRLAKYPIYNCFGTNEAIEYNSAEQLSDRYRATPLLPDEYNTLETVLSNVGCYPYTENFYMAYFDLEEDESDTGIVIK